MIPAIPKRFMLDIVTPDRPILHEEVDEVEIPGEQGYLGVLPGHTPLLAALQVGVLWYRRGQTTSYLAIAYGFAEILPDRVTILAQIAERAEQIDPARAEAARKRAEDRLSRPTGEMDFERARIAMMKALVRLQVASRGRTRA